jgi:uncharacterized protein YbjT (DUF2867 family)
MKVFIIGIAGRAGLRIARLLKEQGTDVDGLYRREDQKRLLDEAGVEAHLGDISLMDGAQLADVVKGSDVIVFTAGAGGKDSDAATNIIDGEGVTKAIAAAGLAGIRRFYLVSVFPEAWRERHMDESFENYIAVKKRADIELTRSDLDWVILRPSALLDEPGTGLISLHVANVHTEVRRDDVAATMVELINTPRIRNVILELTEGSDPITEAVRRIGDRLPPTD